MPTSYERKVSSEEAREGYLLVEKSRLGLFPPVGTPFVLATPTGDRLATLEARDCTCRGPEKPHRHYFVRQPGLQPGSLWRITVEDAGYRLLPL
jgi:hypothetical protein